MDLGSDYVNHGVRYHPTIVTSLAYTAIGDDAICQGEDGVVFSKTGILAWNHSRAALAHYNRATLGNLARVELNAKILRIGVV